MDWDKIGYYMGMALFIGLVVGACFLYEWIRKRRIAKRERDEEQG